MLQVLDQIQRDLDGLADSCRLSREAIGSAKDSTSTLLTDTDRLHREAAVNRKRTELIQKFLQQYQLTPLELAHLEVSIVYAARSTAINCRRLARHSESSCCLLSSLVPFSAFMEAMNKLAMHDSSDIPCELGKA